MISLTEQDLQRFHNKYEPVTESGCWIWTACRAGTGYGTFRVNKHSYSAHRVSYMIHVGNVKQDMHVLHTCDVRECVNPSHLFLGTNLDNIKDAVKKGRKKHKPGFKRPTGLIYKPMSEAGRKAHRRYDDDKRKQVIKLVSSGLSQLETAKRTGMSQANVCRIMKEQK